MRVTRRATLAALGGAATTGLAGCIGGGGGSGAASSCDPSQRQPVQNLPTPTLGPDDAPVTLMVFEDFACPHCADFSLNVFPKIRSNYVESGDVRYEHHDFPIPVLKPWSWKAASAARGVQDATDDATFFEFAHDLFAGYWDRYQNNNPSYSLDHVAEAAEAVGAPKCRIVGDAEHETYRPVLERDKTRGERLGLQGTPAIFIDDGSGSPTYVNPNAENNDFQSVSEAVESRL